MYVFSFDYSDGNLRITYPGTDQQALPKKTYMHEGNKLVGILDENGVRYATWTYDELGQAKSSEHAGGVEKVTLKYDANKPHQKVEVWNGDGTQSHMYYFAMKRDQMQMTEHDKPAGTGCSASYAQVGFDSNGYVNKRTAFDQTVTEYENDPMRGLITETREAVGTPQLRITKTEWDTKGDTPRPQPKRISAPKLLTTYDYYDNGTLHTVTEQNTLDQDGSQRFNATLTGVPRTWIYTYNQRNQVLTVTGPRTDKIDTTTYTYDAIGNLDTITNSAQHVTKFDQYTLDGDVGRITDPNNRITTIRYTPLRQIDTVKVTDGKTSLVTSYKYYPTGLLKSVTQPDQSQISYFYDDAHRLQTVQDKAGNRLVYVYDTQSNVKREEVYDVSGNLQQLTRRNFDQLKRVELLQKGLPENPGQGYQWDMYHNAMDRLFQMNDSLKNTTDIAYDALGRVKSTTLPNANPSKQRANISYDYDGRDQLKSVLDPRNVTTGYEVDGFGNKSGQTSPDSGTDTTEFDVAGNLRKKTDARKLVTKYDYDSLNRLTNISWPNSLSSIPSVFTYDIGANAKGRLSKVTDSSGRLQWAFDGFGRITQQDQVIKNSDGTEQHLWQFAAFDANGRLARHTYPSGIVVKYEYGLDGKPVAISIGNKDNSTTPLLKNISYAATGPVQSWTWGNSSATNINTYARGFDIAGRVKNYPLGHALAGGVQRTLNYDNGNRLTSFTHTGFAKAGDYNQTFGYDGVSRLTSAVAGNASLGYDYDLSHNRTVQSVGANSTSNVIDSNSNRLLSSAGKPYQYDAMGNIKSDGTFTYTYGDDTRMKTASSGNMSATYQYNALGQRVAKTVTPAIAGQSKVYFAYNQAGHLIGEYDANGNAIQETIYLGDMPIAVLKPSAVVGKPTPYYVYSDRLNTPRVITRASDNQMVWRWVGLGPFAENLPEQNPMGLGAFVYNGRLPGQTYDAETGLNYNYFRTYDSKTGRYTQVDPIGLRGGINPFGYVGGNPLEASDTLGLATKSEVSLAISTLIAEYPKELGVPSSVEFGSIDGMARTNWSQKITMDSKRFGDENTCIRSADEYQFLQTLAHEMLHVGQNFGARLLSNSFRMNGPLGYYHLKLDERAEDMINQKIIDTYIKAKKASKDCKCKK